MRAIAAPPTHSEKGSSNHSHRGASLLELVAVVAVLTILALLASLSFDYIRQRSAE